MDAAQLLADARRRLADAPRERLGELVPSRRVLGIPRAARIVPVGHVWHLGALLLGDDAVFATGEIVRARTEARRGYPAQSQRDRAELAAAARRGGFAEGEVAHLGWAPIDVVAVACGEASGPLVLVAGAPSIRWSAAGDPMPLARYLDERVELLRHPPGGST